MKSKKADNALTHGLYAREAVLPWENPEAFAAFHAAIRLELNPAGALEDEAVRDMAELHWRKQRLAMSYLLQFYKSAPSPDLIEAAKGGLAGIATYLAGEGHRSQGIFSGTTSQVLDFIKSGRRPDPAASSKALMLGHADTMCTIVEQAYDPTSIERYLKTEAMIDSRIAKIMGRLVVLKEFKKIYGQKTTQALPSIEAPTLLPAANSAAEPDPTPAMTASTVKARKWGDL